MRTAQRDTREATITFTVNGAAAGGLVQTSKSDLVCQVSHPGAGQYTLTFDTRVVPLSAVGNTQGTAYMVIVGTLGPGSVQITTWNNAFATADGPFRVTITALDKRQ